MIPGLIISGLIIAFGGYMIRFHRKESWIAGYDPATVTDPKAVAVWFGSHLLWMGITGMILALICWILPISQPYQGYPVIGYAVLITIWCIYLAVAGQKFTKEPTSTTSS